MKTKNNELFWRKMLCIYLILLTILVVIKFYGSISDVIYRIQDTLERRANGELNLNLVPFRSISMAIRYSDVRVLLGNIIPFIPMGFLIPNAMYNGYEKL